MNNVKNFVSGLAFLAGFALAVLLTVALYKGTFHSTTAITVKTDRAGLTMAPGAVVKLRGIEIGKVTGVKTAPGGARVSIKVDNSETKWIDKDASARIVPPTAFGAKYIEITSSQPSSATRIQAGDEITSKGVTVEINSAFSHLSEVLAAAQPDKVNNAVTALSSALDGQGNNLGDLVSTTNSYLDTFNESLPVLQQGLDESTSVARTYADLAPDLVTLLGNTSTTAKTLTERQKQLGILSSSLDSFSTNGEDFVSENSDAVTRLLTTLSPATSVLKEYSPIFPCFLSGLARADELAQAAVGGTNPGVSTYTRLQPTDSPYKRTQQLPTAAADLGPDCYGLPKISPADALKPNPDFGTGIKPSTDSTTAPDQSLLDTFFGTLSGLVTTP